MTISLEKKKTFYIILSYFLKGFILISLVFLSQFYFSYVILLFILFSASLLDKTKFENKNRLINLQIVIFSYLLGGFFWLFTLEKGTLILIILLVTYNIPFFISYLLKIPFVLIYIVFELLLNLLEHSIPFVGLGNFFAQNAEAVYWYSYTTSIGGSFWLVLIGWIYFKFKNYYLVVLMFIFPIIFSLWISQLNFKKTQELPHINIISQSHENSNIDYLATLEEELKNIPFFDSNSKTFAILPEASIQGVNLNKFKNSINYLRISKFTNKGVIFVGGVTFYNTETKKPLTGALIFKDKEDFHFQSKKKMVFYTEFIPDFFSTIFGVNKMTYFFDKNNLFPHYKDDFSVLVCYEAFYPFFVRDKLKDADYAFILSSEEFLEGSYYGAKFYNNQIKLRSIENKITIFKFTTAGENLIFFKDGNSSKQL